MTPNEIRSDKPVSKSDEDAFQRYGYAARIAETITNYGHVNSLVAAVYAKWGEGKTSVLNFLKTELAEREDVIIVDFNPWMYSTDEQLLLSFFQVLAGELKKPLKSKGEMVGAALRDYAGTLGLLGSLTGLPNGKEIFKVVGEKLAGKSLDDYRKVVDDALEKSGKKVVVFVDDIDRLSIDEVQAVFKLIKLVADFKNTVYMLSFDDEMVVASLDPIFAAGGQDYLEKIVQLPLRLPKAQPIALKRFSYGLINGSLAGVGIDIDEDESHRFDGMFDDYFLPAIQSPRFAVRYANSLYFSLPLLKGEVNMVDLMLMEGIKVIYPKLYRLIRDNTGVFTRNYNSDSGSLRSKQKSAQEAREFINAHLNEYPESERNGIRAMFQKLFPPLDGVFANIQYGEPNWRKWYEGKRVCSGRYIDRYFSYVVLDGEISDVFFDELISKIASVDYIEKPAELTTLFAGLDGGEFAMKLQFLEESFSPETKKGLAKNLCLLGSVFPHPKTFFRFGDAFWQMGLFVKGCIVDQPNKADQLALANIILQRAQPLSFAFEVWAATTHSKKERYSEELAFSEKEIKGLSRVLYERARGEMELKDLLVSLDDVNFRDLAIIGGDIHSRKIKAELKAIIEADDSMFIRLLHSFSSTTMSTSEPEPYKSDFNEAHYKLLQNVMSVNYFFQKSRALFGNQSKIERKPDREKLSDKELVGYFQKIHLSSKAKDAARSMEKTS